MLYIFLFMGVPIDPNFGVNGDIQYFKRLYLFPPTVGCIGTLYSFLKIFLFIF